MTKGECLHPELSKILTEIGHTQQLCITDAGFPVDSNPKLIALGWKKNNPRFLDVCKLIKELMVIEKIYIAKEFKERNKIMHDEYVKAFEGIEIEYISHEQFKKDSSNAKAIVKTGEFSPFCNCIFQSGVCF